MAVDSPRRQNSLGEAIFARAANVVHDLMTSIFENGVANACSEGVECFVPGGAFPFPLAAFTGPFERMENAIGIGYLIECSRTFGAVAPTRTGMLRITFKLLNLA